MWRHAEDLNVASDDYTDIFGKLMLLYSARTQDELIFHVGIAGLYLRVVKQANNFLISQPKHMLWVLKRTVSMRQFF